MISGKEMHMKEAPTEPKRDLSRLPHSHSWGADVVFFDRLGFGVGELKLFSLPIRSAGSPWHDSYPRGSRTIPPPRGSVPLPDRIGLLCCWSACFRPAVACYALLPSAGLPCLSCPALSAVAVL